MGFSGAYGVVTTTGSETTLFLGAGKSISKGNLKLETEDGTGSATVTLAEGNLFITADTPVVLTLEDTYGKGELVLKVGELRVEGLRIKAGTRKLVNFSIPGLPYQQVVVQLEKR